jgi:hypothetical protein
MIAYAWYALWFFLGVFAGGGLVCWILGSALQDMFRR